MTVSNLQRSSAANIVPDTCSFTAVVRTVPGMDPLDLDAKTQAILTDLARDTGGGITLETAFRAGIPAVATSPDHPLVAAAVEAVRAATSHTPAVTGFTGGTDAAILAPAFELPFVICGPGRLEVAHQVDEWVDVEELAAAAMAYVQIAQRLLG